MMHRFKMSWVQPWLCSACGQPRGAEIHGVNLAPMFHEIRNTARRIDWGERKEFSLNEVRASMEIFCNRHGTTYNFVGRPDDPRYRTCSRNQFVQLLTDHWFDILPAVTDFSDCDDQSRWFKVWAAVCQVTAVAEVKDYGTQIPHTYNLVMFDDRSCQLVDPVAMFILPGKTPSWEFKDKVHLYL